MQLILEEEAKFQEMDEHTCVGLVGKTSCWGCAVTDLVGLLAPKYTTKRHKKIELPSEFEWKEIVAVPRVEIVLPVPSPLVEAPKIEIKEIKKELQEAKTKTTRRSTRKPVSKNNQYKVTVPVTKQVKRKQPVTPQSKKNKITK